MRRMGQRTVACALLAAMIACMTGAQLLFKSAGLHALKHPNIWEGWVVNWPMWLGLLASGIGLASWLGCLRTLPLASAYPWTAAIYILTPGASIYFFEEPLTQRYFLGAAVLALGIGLCARGSAQNDGS